MLTVAMKSEDEMLADLGTEIGFLTSVASFDGEPLELDGYQLAFLQNQSKYRWVVKARQVEEDMNFAPQDSSLAKARCSRAAMEDEESEGTLRFDVKYVIDDVVVKATNAAHAAK